MLRRRHDVLRSRFLIGGTISLQCSRNIWLNTAVTQRGFRSWSQRKEDENEQDESKVENESQSQSAGPGKPNILFGDKVIKDDERRRQLGNWMRRKMPVEGKEQSQTK